MKGIILLADYFEDMEAISTIDCLRRANIKIDLISINHSLELTTQSGIKIIADARYEDIELNNYDFLVIPGGKAVYVTHLNNIITKTIIEHFMKRKSLVAAICAAPMLLDEYLVNKDFTCFPSAEVSIKGNYTSNKVEVVDNIITSKAAGTVIEFSNAIITYLKNKEIADTVIKNIYYK